MPFDNCLFLPLDIASPYLDMVHVCSSLLYILFYVVQSI